MIDNTYPIPKEELQARYWFLSHLTDVKKLGHGIFLFFDVILVLIVLGYAINLYGIHLLSYPRALRAMAQPLLQTNPESYLVQPLNTMEVGGISPSNDRSDLYALMQNPNTAFMARFTYSFFYNNTKQGSFDGFLYPGEQKYLIGLALSPLSGSTARVDVSNLQWIHLTNQELLNVKTRTGLITKDYEFANSTGELPFNRLIFTLENKTGYQFSNVALPVVLRYGGRVVALNYTIIDTIPPASSRMVDLRWFAPVGVIDGYAITPTIDIFDQSTFLTPAGEPLPPVRR
ncbi:MAG: hypothetical protein Q8P11_01725 [bacterium]|nr:hypothetical protein [bacterium]